MWHVCDPYGYDPGEIDIVASFESEEAAREFCWAKNTLEDSTGLFVLEGPTPNAQADVLGDLVARARAKDATNKAQRAAAERAAYAARREQRALEQFILAHAAPRQRGSGDPILHFARQALVDTLAARTRQ